jgi:uncharacterized membrane protein YhaH (DUF805 family)
MFSRNRPDRDDRRKTRYGLLHGRCSRIEYWAGIGLVVALAVGAGLLHFRLGSGLGTVVLFLMVRRLHDAGRTGWWAVGLQVAPLIIGGLLIRAIGMNQAMALWAFLTLASVILLGWLPEDGENRFGPPRRWGPRARHQDDIAEVFS